MEDNNPTDSALPWPREVRPPDTSNFSVLTYAPSQFDLMKVLTRVAQRPNPKIDLGPIDWSAAIIVCDASLEDVPIVYCSEAFCELTGYDHSDVIGRNCRFLQTPGLANHEPADRRREPGADQVRIIGSPAQTVDLQQELIRMKDSLARHEEVQVVLLNYTRSGHPFLNLVTIVPVEIEENGDNHRYLVGFQANSVSSLLPGP